MGVPGRHCPLRENDTQTSFIACECASDRPACPPRTPTAAPNEKIPNMRWRIRCRRAAAGAPRNTTRRPHGRLDDLESEKTIWEHVRCFACVSSELSRESRASMVSGRSPLARLPVRVPRVSRSPDATVRLLALPTGQHARGHVRHALVIRLAFTNARREQCSSEQAVARGG